MSKKNGYEFGREFEYDELRANVNLSNILAGKYKRKGKRRKK
jgi:hypothetical protein